MVLRQLCQRSGANTSSPAELLPALLLPARLGSEGEESGAKEIISPGRHRPTAKGPHMSAAQQAPAASLPAAGEAEHTRASGLGTGQNADD